MLKNEEFLDALGHGMPEDERLIVCAFEGDPDTAPLNAWKPRPWKPGKQTIACHLYENGYVTISSFRRAADKSWRRRGECWAAGRALMVDDIGTKLPRTIIDPLPPSALIETSPDNFQAWYFLAEPERDQLRFDALIRAFISQQLLGADPGMSGITRVGRLPHATNGKKKYGGFFKTRAAEWNPERRFTVSELVRAFGLTLAGQHGRVLKPVVSESAAERVREWKAAVAWLESRKMLKRDTFDASGWVEMHCPWRDGHTGGADTGAAIRQPHPDNAYIGAFRCHHGHCAGRGWTELTDWINELVVESLEMTNDAAK